MDRVIAYPGQIPLDSDLLGTNRNAMIALSKLAAAILGTTTSIHGLEVSASTPAALSVTVGPGEIYMLGAVDSTAYGTLLADPRQVLKQGVMFDPVTVALPNITAAGQSVNYLIQATFVDEDAAPVVLPYYNSANPSMALSGPGNSGASQYSLRKGRVQVAAKAGTAATTGTQVTPAPDAGNIGLWVVTLAYGQTTVDTGVLGSSASPKTILQMSDYLTNAQAVQMFMPTGHVYYFAGDTPPVGSLKANGAAVSRTTYAQLYSVIGTRYGAGDGSTTFNLPDGRGESLLGWDDGRGVDAGRVNGSWQAGQSNTLVAAEMNNVDSPPTSITIPQDGSWSNWLISGDEGVSPNWSHRFKLSGAETKTRNLAMLACIKY